MKPCTRRRFVIGCSRAVVGSCFAMSLVRGVDLLAQLPGGRPVGLREARYYTRLPNGDVQCTLCPCSPLCGNGILRDPELVDVCNAGLLVPGQTCVCKVRRNIGGTLYVTNYGRTGKLFVDPVEKNPLHHFLPGSGMLAVSAPGCSLACKGCQNWELALSPTENVDTVEATPSRVVELAGQSGVRGIAYTYTEPMMFFEYMMDVASLARERGLVNTVVTGGYVNAEPVAELCGVIDAFSISVKAFTEQEYIDYARGRLSVIQRAMETVRRNRRWLEVVVLVIPTISDDLTKMKTFLRWAHDALGPDTPIHFSRFWPSYRLKNLPQTPLDALEKARQLAQAHGFKYAYVGNIPGHEGANTFCPRCRTAVIRRVGFKVSENRLGFNGRCPKCSYQLAGVWKTAGATGRTV